MSKRYFINNIDTFIGQQLLSELFKQPEDADPIDPSEYKIMATYTDHYRLDKQQGVKKILKRYKPKLSRKKMLEENDVWIYDLNYPEDLKFVQSVIESVPTFEEQKILVLISDVRGWGKTPKKVKVHQQKQQEDGQEEVFKQEVVQEEVQVQQGDDENQDDADNQDNEQDEDKKDFEATQLVQELKQDEIVYEQLKESDYKDRVPLDQFQHYKQWEDQFMSLQKENFKVIVICAGILYGAGEIIFKNHFQSAWKQNPVQLPYLNSGDNLIPTIYVKDLIKFVIKVSESPPEAPCSYLLAIDNSKNKSLKAIVEAISNEVGSGKTVSVENDSMITDDIKQSLSLNLDLRPSSLLVGEEEAAVEFDWTCEKGLTQNIKIILKEFKKAENLRPIKILVFFPENQINDLNTKNILNGLSQSYNIPIISIQDIFDSILQSNGELKNDLQENYQKILDSVKNPSKQLDEITKILFRCIKQRLMNNDCSNRGFILVNCPQYHFDCDITFYNQKNKLKSKKIKQKEKKINEDGEEVEEEVEEQQEEQQEENEEEGQKQEEFFPESIIILKSLKKLEKFNLTAFNFFKQKNLDVLIYDPTEKSSFEISESLRVYIERKGRPFNYLKNEQALKVDYDAYYQKVNSEIQNAKIQTIKEKQLEQLKEQQNTQQLIDIVSKSVQKEVKNNDLNEKTSLRQFLMKNIVPSLSDGLLEVSKIKPSDPVEFLAEYLFAQSFDLQ